jgi:hypothetical protein
MALEAKRANPYTTQASSNPGKGSSKAAKIPKTREAVEFALEESIRKLARAYAARLLARANTPGRLLQRNGRLYTGTTHAHGHRPVSPSQLYETAKTIPVENEHTRKPKKP